MRSQRSSWSEFVVRDGYAAISRQRPGVEHRGPGRGQQARPPRRRGLPAHRCLCLDTLAWRSTGSPSSRRTTTHSATSSPASAFTYPVHAEMDLRWHDFSVSKA